MKKITIIFVLFTILTFSEGISQTMIYNENFGDGANSPTLLTNYTDFQNQSVVYSGTAEIRSTIASTGYVNSSGLGSVFLAGVTTGSDRTLIIDGINTSNFENITLRFGHYKSTNASSNELEVAISEDGSNWTNLIYTRPSGSSTSNWILITPTGAIPSTQSLKIKFTNYLNSNVGFRIDDILLMGTEVLSLNNFQNSFFKIYPTVVSNGFINVVSEENSSKQINIYDISGKELNRNSVNEVVDVSFLSAGTYFIKIIENNKIETKRFIIK